MTFRNFSFALLLTALASSCTTTTATTTAIPFSQVTAVNVEIDYMPNAEPYTGNARGLADIWSITRTNLQRLYKGRTVTVPTTLPTMEKITDVTGNVFSVDDILAIASRHRSMKNDGTKVAYYLVFLDGYLKDEATGKASQDVLGVSIGDTGVVAMFKPVIKSADSGPINSGVTAFVEQSTLTHELGHATGLVNRTLTMVAAHQDSAHGAHCTNTKCVMYWENEGAAAARQFITRYLTTGTELLFGDECLADADNASTAKGD